MAKASTLAFIRCFIIFTPNLMIHNGQSSAFKMLAILIEINIKGHNLLGFRRIIFYLGKLTTSQERLDYSATDETRKKIYAPVILSLAF